MSIADRPIAAQTHSRDLVSSDRSRERDLEQLRAWIRAAIEQAGWNHEALSEAMGKDRRYIGRVLTGEKPMSASFIRELPDDVEAIVARFYAESFGHVVVLPSRGDEAVRHLVAGLIGVFDALKASALPVKAGAPIKAALPEQKREKRSA